MPKTISDEKLTKAKALVDSTVEPRIIEILDTLNVVLGKHGIRAGVEMTWLFDEIGEPAKPQKEIHEDEDDQD